MTGSSAPRAARVRHGAGLALGPAPFRRHQPTRGECALEQSGCRARRHRVACNGRSRRSALAAGARQRRRRQRPTPARPARAQRCWARRSPCLGRREDAPHPERGDRLEQQTGHETPRPVPVPTSRPTEPGSTSAENTRYASGDAPTTTAERRACADSDRASAAAPIRSRSDAARPSSARARCGPPSVRPRRALPRRRTSPTPRSTGQPPARPTSRRRVGVPETRRRSPASEPSPPAIAATPCPTVPPPRRWAAICSARAEARRVAARCARVRSTTGTPHAGDRQHHDGHDRPGNIAAATSPAAAVAPRQCRPPTRVRARGRHRRGRARDDRSHPRRKPPPPPLPERARARSVAAARRAKPQRRSGHSGPATASATLSMRTTARPGRAFRAGVAPGHGAPPARSTPRRSNSGRTSSTSPRPRGSPIASAPPRPPSGYRRRRWPHRSARPREQEDPRRPSARASRSQRRQARWRGRSRRAVAPVFNAWACRGLRRRALADDDAVGPPSAASARLPFARARALAFGGRGFEAQTCGWASRSSAVSSMVTTRSPAGIAAESELSRGRLARAGASGDQEIPSGDRPRGNAGRWHRARRDRSRARAGG